MLMILAAILGGATAFTGVLWFAGFGSMGAVPTERLARLKNEEEQLSVQSGPSLRRRVSVQLGGINLVSSNIVAKWTLQLERAGLALNVREYFILRVTVALILTAVGMLFLPIPQLGLAFAPLGYAAVGFWLKMRIGRRTRKLEAQLVELLQTLASGLRAGFGLVQAMETAQEQIPAPLGLELRRTLRDTAMGSSIEKALLALNDRVGSPDFDIVLTAVLIQRSVGGNLAEILDNVAHTMRERERIRGEIRTLTSQQRMTGYVIGGIPVGLAIAFFFISPDFVKLLFTDPLGNMMLGAAVVMEGMGFFVISRIVNIEV